MFGYNLPLNLKIVAKNTDGFWVLKIKILYGSWNLDLSSKTKKCYFYCYTTFFTPKNTEFN